MSRTVDNNQAEVGAGAHAVNADESRGTASTALQWRITETFLG